MDSNKQLTIEDVAKYAGVSTATVGRVVGNYGSVSDKTRKKVLKAIDALHFRPNTIAQGLRSNNTRTIAVIMGSIKNNYYNQLVFAIEEEAALHGYNVLICNTHEQAEKEWEALNTVYSKKVDGVILSSVYTVKQQVPCEQQHLYDGSVPIVCVDRRVRGINADLVQSRNEKSSYDATNHLLSLGHKKIGIVATLDYSTVRERMQGHRRALEDAGIEFDDGLVVVADYEGNADVQQQTARLLACHPDITALYVLNNTLCGRVLLELKRCNLSCPEDISLLTWDDEEINRLFDLTTVVQPIDETGKVATKRLLELIQHPQAREETQSVHMDTKLLIRKSTAGPRKTKLFLRK